MFQVNQQIGLYHLVRPIGRGGFGEVWLAERRTEILTTVVAIKLPHREQINLEAIRQEAELWAKASGHANILPIIEANIYDGQIVIVSEYAPDGSLEEKLQQGIPLKQSLEIVIGILNGLEFLHARNIIHRDIKPANILLQGETPRLADFGISRIIKTTALSTSIVGTPKYMAPESFDGKRTVQTDVWSVGVILYQMLCGNVPFPQENPTELMYAIVFKEIAPMSESIPPDLRRILNKALAKQPENRFQSAREMREELQRSLLNISHPSFAPTEVLQRKPIDNLTIEDKSIFTNQPLPVPPTEPQKPSAVAPFVDKTINQNQPPNLPIQDNPILPTVPSVEPQFQESPPQTAVTKLTNRQKRGFHWGFYLLPPFLDFFVRWGTLVLSIILVESLFGKTTDPSPRITEILYFAIPMGIIVYGFLGAVFGYFFPRFNWKWGLLLNSTMMFPPFFKVAFVMYLFTIPVACLGAYLAARLSPRKPAAELAKPSEEWTTTWIVRWVFYFVAPIIGILTYLICQQITRFSFYQRDKYGWSYETFLVIDLISIIFLIVLVFGITGALLGYFFPQQKWRWGLWLNLLNVIWIVRLYLVRLGSGYYSTETAGLFVFVEIIRFLVLFSVPCITSYLGSWLALRKAEK